MEGFEVILECFGDYKLIFDLIDIILKWLKDEKIVEDNDKIKNKWVIEEERGERMGFFLIIKNVFKEDVGYY